MGSREDGVDVATAPGGGEEGEELGWAGVEAGTWYLFGG